MNTLDQHATLFKALARPERLRILALLRDRSLCVIDMTDTLAMEQGTLSAHLAVLRREGLVDYRKEGLLHRYYICPDVHKTLQALVGHYTAAQDESGVIA